MTEPARGIHAHRQRKLGRKPGDPSRPRLLLNRVLTGEVPPHPPAADHFSAIDDWGLYGNDLYGDCGPVSVANSLKLVTKYLTGTEVSVDQTAVFDLYRRSGNPGFNPDTHADDNGVIMQTMLEALLADGIGGHKPVAFGQINISSVNDLLDAIAVFGVVLLGVDLKVAQQAQTDLHLWDYRAKSREWGGHAIPAGRYTDAPDDAADRTAVVTWAELVDMTDSFIQHQVDEVWVVIWPEHFKDDAFLAGVDLNELAQAYEQLTGRELPLPEPTPAPEPDPEPTPAPVPNGGLDDEIIAFLRHIYESIKDFFAGR
jgi:hypothetical protein